jgi:hypothetical protein
VNENLKNALIIIVIISAIYYFFSPYQNCMRELTWGNDEVNKMDICNGVTKW